MRILEVRRGRAPNCSSAGSVVGAALLGAVAGAAVINLYAAAFTEWVRRATDGRDDGTKPESAPRIRASDDGGTLALPGAPDRPPALLALDTAGVAAALAAGARRVGDAARAPDEVHLTVTTRCPAACTACYLSAGPGEKADPSLAKLRSDLDQLADMGVFEVAFGGGEAVLRDDLLALADHARSRGLVPNLTTSGFGVTPARAEAIAARFGQVNVSIDGVGAAYAAVRGWGDASLGLAAVRALADAGARVGVNTVLTRVNVSQLRALAAAIVDAGATEWQWLRLKPAGRGVDAYAGLALDEAQRAALWPLALELERATGLVIRWDCAMTPFLAQHGSVSPEDAARLGVVGCVGGTRLMARDARGGWSPCSFAGVDRDEAAGGEIPPAVAYASDERVLAWRGRAGAPPAPCDTCGWRHVCRGGCRVVARHLTGDELAPDPECARVRAWQA